MLSLLPSLVTCLGSPQLTSGHAVAQPTGLRRVTVITEQFRALASALDELNRTQPACLISDADISRQLRDENTQDYLLESSHPYPGGDKVFYRSLYLSGANVISICFDPRSSTINKNDSLKVTGDGGSNLFDSGEPVVGPYYGSRSDGRWPTGSDLFPSSTVTLDLSANTREDSKDVRRWGFRCFVRGLCIMRTPWLLSLQHTLCSVTARICTGLITGGPPSPSEQALRPLLDDQGTAAAAAAAGRSGFGSASAAPREISDARVLVQQGLEEFRHTHGQAVLADESKGPAEAGLLVRVGSSVMAAATVHSPVEQLLQAFITGDTNVEGITDLLAEVATHEPRILSAQLIRNRPAPERNVWERSMRAVMAAMFKHSGLSHELYRCFAGVYTVADWSDCADMCAQ